MIINMTECPSYYWTYEKLEAVRKLCKDNRIRDMKLPTVLPTDDSSDVRNMAVDAEMAAAVHHPDAIILQGEPVFVAAFVSYYCFSQCYSPCYADGKFVQFRRF